MESRNAVRACETCPLGAHSDVDACGEEAPGPAPSYQDQMPGGGPKGDSTAALPVVTNGATAASGPDARGEMALFSTSGRLTGVGGVDPAPRDSGQISDNPRRPQRRNHGRRHVLRTPHCSASDGARSTAGPRPQSRTSRSPVRRAEGFSTHAGAPGPAATTRASPSVHAWPPADRCPMTSLGLSPPAAILLRPDALGSEDRAARSPQPAARGRGEAREGLDPGS